MAETIETEIVRKHLGGRPTDYREEYINSVDTYISECVDYIEKDKKTVKIPSIEGFAKKLGVNKTSLYEWQKKHPLFSNAIDKIMDEQKERLFNQGLAGNYNPMIAKLGLSANHGMKEKSEVEQSGETTIKITWAKPNDTDHNPILAETASN